MKPLHMFEKLFVSITYAEERMFERVSFKKLLQKWNDTWVAVAFAEGGVNLFESEYKKAKPKITCELGDISCFMTRNT